MKKNSSVRIVALLVGAVVLIVAIFKLLPMIIRSQQPNTDGVITEEVIELVEPMYNQTDMDSSQAPCSVMEITTPEQIDELAQSKQPMVIKFYAPWCGACQYVGSFYANVAQALPGVAFYSIDVGNKKVMDRIEEAGSLLSSPVEYLPTFVYRSNGYVVKQTTGAQEQAAMVEAIAQALNS